jgi:DNA-binding NarL/FixJ family response regulator
MSKTTTVKIVIVDDHPVVRIGLQAIVNSEKSYQTVGEAATGKDAIALINKLLPDIVLMDMRLPDISGAVATAEILKSHPHCGVIFISLHDGETDIQRALEAGAKGYLTKSCEKQEIIDAIRRVAGGGRYIPERISANLLEFYGSQKLTAREIEILEHVSRGMSNRDIAGIFGLCEETIKTHVARILDKLNVKSRTQAVAFGVKRGIIHM